MKVFTNFDDYTDDDLIFIIFDEKGNWQDEAVEYAKYLLKIRGVSDEFASKRINELNELSEILWQKELEFRANESFNAFELIYRTIFWIKYILWDWYLAKNGFFKKRKQRLITIGLGALIYLIFISYVLLTHDETEKARINEINKQALLDSINISNIDWSGDYEFIDSSIDKRNNIVWHLNLIKNKSEHQGRLTLLQNKEELIIRCIGYINKEEFEFYPDTTYQILNGQIISYYDRLFTFVKDSSDIITYWGKITPYNMNKGHGIKFKKLTAGNK